MAGRPSAIREFVETAIGNVGIMALGFLSSVLAARLLGADGRGALASVQLWPSFCVIIGMVGMPNAVLYYASRRRERAGSYLVSGLLITLLASVAMSGVLMVVLPRLLASKPDEVIAAARIYALLPVVLGALQVLYHPLRAAGRTRLFNVARLLVEVTWSLALLLALVSGRESVEFIASSHLVALAVLVPVIGILSFGVAGMRGRPQRALVKQLLSYGLPTTAAALPQVVNFRLDQLVLVGFVSSRQLGLYVTGVGWSQVVLLPLSTIAFLVVPRLAALDHDDRNHIVARLSRTTVALAVVVSVPVALVTPLALPLIFGSSFTDGVPAAIILAIAAAFLGYNLVAEEAFRGLGLPKVAITSQLLGFAATGAGLLVLLPPFGITGAALTSLVSYASSSVYLTARLRRDTALPTSEFLHFRRHDAAYLRLHMTGSQPLATRGEGVASGTQA